MADTDSIQPPGEKMRKTLRWISETLAEHPEKTRHQIIQAAQVRFDLTPKECSFLDANFDKQPTKL